MTRAIASPEIEVVVESPLWVAYPKSEAVAHGAVAAALAASEASFAPGAELAIIFADDAHIRELNRDWRDKDRPTNVLTFPAAEGPEIERSPLLGDIVLAYETVEREAEDEGKAFLDHLAHLVVHGTLHLFGYDHISDEDAGIMENIERVALARLGIADPYEETLPAHAARV